MSRESTQALRWWEELRHPERGDRGALARLRRASSVLDAATEPATIELCRKLGVGEEKLERVALIAAVLAHVRDNEPTVKMARQLGQHEANPQGMMSWLRFRRLVQAETADEQLTQFRRAIALAKQKANIGDLAESLLNWTEARRRGWIYAYHDAGQAQPNDIQTNDIKAGEPQS